MVMLERMFINAEKENLAKDKKLAVDDPDNFVPCPAPVIESESDVEAELPPSLNTSAASVDLLSSGQSPANSALYPASSPPSSPIRAKKRRMTDSDDETSQLDVKDEKTSANTYTLHATGGLKIVIKNSPLHMKSPNYVPDVLRMESSEDKLKSGLKIKKEPMDRILPLEAKTQDVTIKLEDEEMHSDIRGRTSIPFDSYSSDDAKDDFVQSQGEEFLSPEYTSSVADTSMLIDVDDDLVPPGAGGYVSSQDEGDFSEADTAVAGLLSTSWQETSQDDALNASADDMYASGDFDTDIQPQANSSVGPDGDMLDDSDDDSDDADASGEINSLVADFMGSYSSEQSVTASTDHVNVITQSDFMGQDLGHQTSAELSLIQAERPDFDMDMDMEEFVGDNLNVEMQSAIDSILSLQQSQALRHSIPGGNRGKHGLVMAQGGKPNHGLVMAQGLAQGLLPNNEPELLHTYVDQSLSSSADDDGQEQPDDDLEAAVQSILM
jgi:hypothetical protein